MAKKDYFESVKNQARQCAEEILDTGESESLTDALDNNQDSEYCLLLAYYTFMLLPCEFQDAYIEKLERNLKR